VQQAVTVALQAYLSPLTGGLWDQSAATPSGAPSEPGSGAASSGWPLETDVRSQDVAAAAARVTGVRSVEAVALGMLDPDGTLIEGIDRVPLNGLQLPDATVAVTIGTPSDITLLMGADLSTPTAPEQPSLVPVPLAPPGP
jgi:hypothetical protein